MLHCAFSPPVYLQVSEEGSRELPVASWSLGDTGTDLTTELFGVAGEGGI